MALISNYRGGLWRLKRRLGWSLFLKVARKSLIILVAIALLPVISGGLTYSRHRKARRFLRSRSGPNG